MRKLLLLAAVALTGLTANAQLLKKNAEAKTAKMPMTQLSSEKAMAQRVDATTKGMKKSQATGLWYQVEEGIPFYGWDESGSGYGASFITVPAFTDFTAKNMSAKPTETKWFIGNTDVTEIAEANGDLILSVDAGYQRSTYTLASADGNDTFNYTDLMNARFDSGSGKKAYFLPGDEVSPLTFMDVHVVTAYYGTGYLSSKYIFGTGEHVANGATYRSYGYAQDYAKPKSPMYVESVFIQSLSYGDNPLPAGEELKMLIVDAEGNQLAVLTCKPEDLIIEEKNSYGFAPITAVFANKEVDELTGEEVPVPFVLDQEFSVIVLYSAHSDIGFYGAANTGDVFPVGKGLNLCYNVADESDEAAFACTFSVGAASAPVTFNALFDKILVWETASAKDQDEDIADFNVLKVSADAQTIENAGYPKFKGVMANTAFSWFDEEGNENYYLDVEGKLEFPEWILGYSVDNSSWEATTDDEFDPSVAISLECDPLPAGVEGRGCKLYVVGRGFTSETPIYVLQGNYTKEQCDKDEEAAGINNATTSVKAQVNGTYNLAGQRVNKEFKGIAIQNGKKVIKK